MRFVSLTALLFLASSANAQCVNGNCSMSSSRMTIKSTPAKTRIVVHESAKTVSQVQVAGPKQTKEPPLATEALDEVNAARARRGLRPFVRDDGLTAGAMNVARFRAERLMFGHTSNDFRGLPPGVAYSAAGCAAYPASMGWLSCCTYDNHQFAGAAWVMGRDGKRYMHLFVR